MFRRSSASSRLSPVGVATLPAGYHRGNRVGTYGASTAQSTASVERRGLLPWPRSMRRVPMPSQGGVGRLLPPRGWWRATRSRWFLVCGFCVRCVLIHCVLVHCVLVGAGCARGYVQVSDREPGPEEERTTPEDPLSDPEERSCFEEGSVPFLRFTEGVKPTIDAKCSQCHLEPGNVGPGFLGASPDAEAMHGFLGLSVVIGTDEAGSIFVNRGRHFDGSDATDLSMDERAAAITWIEALAACRSAE